MNWGGELSKGECLCLSQHERQSLHDNAAINDMLKLNAVIKIDYWYNYSLSLIEFRVIGGIIV